MRRLGPDTEAEIVRLGHELIQVGGYHSLNYGEIASVLGITRAAVHHHFPSKADLARRIIVTYREWTIEQFALIESSSRSIAEVLDHYVSLYRTIIDHNDVRVCPGGMMAAEAMTLPEELRAEVGQFFDVHVDWLAKTLRASGRDEATAEGQALHLVTSLQGALLVCRLYRRTDHFDMLASNLVAELAEPSGGEG